MYNNARQSPGVDEVIEAELRLSQLESLPDPARDAAVKALQAVVALYGAGLERILDLAPQVGPMLAEDELVAHLLLVHGLHPVALSSRVEVAAPQWISLDSLKCPIP